MSITSPSGPVVTQYDDPLNQISGNTVPANTNPEDGPSAFAHGQLLLDPRYQFTYNPGQDFGKAVCGWNNTWYEAVNQAPSTKQTNNIATAQTATANTALVLTAGTGVTSGVTITRADTGATVTGLLALDSAMTTIKFGSSGTVQIWDPRTAVSRCIGITSNGADQTGTYTIAGFDIYGFPMTQAVTGGAGTPSTTVLVTSTKAFKYVQSVTPAGTVNSTGVVVGTLDVFGFPLRADDFGHVDLSFNGILSTGAAGTFTAAVTTAATTTSGDVRGTFAIATASDAVKVLVIFQSIPASNLGYFGSSGTVTGMLGVPQK